MNKKYQIFVSSTYEDLKKERLAAMSSILETNGIPVGMEQFPASPLSQWEIITKMIDMSDYYIVIAAGRYGSIDEESGLSYTEKEYEYAVKKTFRLLLFCTMILETYPLVRLMTLKTILIDLEID